MQRNIFQEYSYIWRSFFDVMSIFLKYQIITKLLFSMLIFPVFWGGTQALISSKGIGAISNSEMLKYLFSIQGILFLSIGGLIFIASILIEICGFITISSRSINNRSESSYKELLKSNFKNLPKMFEFGSIIMLMYIAILAPLTKIGVTLSFMEDFRIPNFIKSVIEENIFYSLLYFCLILFMLILSIKWIFTFQFIVVARERPSLAMKKSSVLVRKNLKEFLKYFISTVILNLVIFTVLSSVWIFLIEVFISTLNLDTNLGRIIIIMLFILQSIVFGIGSLLFLPFELHHLTILFYRFIGKTKGFEILKEKYPIIPKKTEESLIDRILKKRRMVISLLFISSVIISIPISLFFEDFFAERNDIVIVGHRGGGGFNIPENSISSIQNSIQYGAQYVEIDVQRTKDGRYIINHDKNFNRLAGEKRASYEMTLDEIKLLDIGKNYPIYKGERVVTLEELLDYCKGKIGIYVELKGLTADKKMADEVIKLIEEKDMKDEIIIMSLDYNLIKYVNQNYDYIKTGFVYFLALGDVGTFEADYIILEEDAATDKALEKIHYADKKAVVWTVNKLDSMNKFAASDVDAIITDDVRQMKEIMKRRSQRKKSDILLDFFFN